MATPLILKRNPVGDHQEDYSVLENGVIVGRIFHLDAAAPQGRPWMWASGHSAGTVKRARTAMSLRGRRRWRRSLRAGGATLQELMGPCLQRCKGE
jgi:hypothetical protein